VDRNLEVLFEESVVWGTRRRWEKLEEGWSETCEWKWI